MDEGLSQEVLLDHFRNPRGRGALSGDGWRRAGVNPACGDKVALNGRLAEGRLELRVEGAGCVISQASASMMAQALAGRPIEEARRLAAGIRGWIAGRGPSPAPDDEALSDLEALAGVRRHPARVKCACLAWDLFLEGERHAADGG